MRLVTESKKTLYVVRDQDSEGNEEEAIWTLSFDPERSGWNTDGGCPGYGLEKQTADEIADRYNREC